MVEYQPPANTYPHKWYRLYSDGWVEQGGRATKYSTIELPIEMQTAYYEVLFSMNITGQDNVSYSINADSMTTTTFRVRSESNLNQGEAAWVVHGPSARGATQQARFIIKY